MLHTVTGQSTLQAGKHSALRGLEVHSIVEPLQPVTPDRHSIWQVVSVEPDERRRKMDPGDDAKGACHSAEMNRQAVGTSNTSAWTQQARCQCIPASDALIRSRITVLAAAFSVNSRGRHECTGRPAHNCRSREDFKQVAMWRVEVNADESTLTTWHRRGCRDYRSMTTVGLFQTQPSLRQPRVDKDALRRELDVVSIERDSFWLEPVQSAIWTRSDTNKRRGARSASLTVHASLTATRYEVTASHVQDHFSVATEIWWTSRSILIFDSFHIHCRHRRALRVRCGWLSVRPESWISIRQY